jgi:hypothetical protein
MIVLKEYPHHGKYRKHKRFMDSRIASINTMIITILVGIILGSMIIASLPTVITAQPISDSSIEELMTTLLKTSGQNSSQSQTANVTRSELAQSIDKIVNTDSSCNILFNRCAKIIYESPSRVVLTGDFIIRQNYNVVIWKAVDILETNGFRLTSIDLTGQGSKGIPHSYLIVMSKWLGLGRTQTNQNLCR